MRNPKTPRRPNFRKVRLHSSNEKIVEQGYSRKTNARHQVKARMTPGT